MLRVVFLSNFATILSLWIAHTHTHTHRLTMPHALRRSFARKNENKTQFSGPENVGRLTTSRRSRRMIWRCERHTYNNGNASTTSRMYNITTATDDDAVGPKCHRDKFNWVFEKFIVCQAEANTKHTYVSYVVICAICNCLCGSGQTLQVHHMLRLPPNNFHYIYDYNSTMELNKCANDANVLPYSRQTWTQNAAIGHRFAFVHLSHFRGANFAIICTLSA